MSSLSPRCSNGETPARTWMRHIATQVVMLGRDVQDQEGGVRSCLPISQMGARPTKDILPLVNGLTGGNTDDIDAALDHIIRSAGLDPNAWGLYPEFKKEGVHAS